MIRNDTNRTACNVYVTQSMATEKIQNTAERN